MSQWQVKLNGESAHKNLRSRDDLYDELMHCKSIEVEVCTSKGLQAQLKKRGIPTETVKHPKVL